MRTRATRRCIGILTAGGDCPGLNAAIRAVAKSAHHHGIQVVGFLDGFRGLVENRSMLLDDRVVSGILTQGGTLLGTSRDKPHKMDMGGKIMDMTAVAAANARQLQLECLVCLGGNGTQKNAWQLHKNAGLNVLTLPKTIDNDVAMTDISFGYDTALTIATEAIDRLHTTATSHHRIIVCELMGHSAGWLALGAGIAGGADVILIPEIPYDVHAIADFILARQHSGKRFSIIAMAEGACTVEEAEALAKAAANAKKGLAKKKTKEEPAANGTLKGHVMIKEPKVNRIARELQELTGIDARTTSLGHVQRGGTPTPADRLLCTRLGTTAGELLAGRRYNVMVGVQGAACVPVPLDQVAGVVRRIPADHAWLRSAVRVGTCLGVHGLE